MKQTDFFSSRISSFPLCIKLGTWECFEKCTWIPGIHQAEGSLHCCDIIICTWQILQSGDTDHHHSQLTLTFTSLGWGRAVAEIEQLSLHLQTPFPSTQSSDCGHIANTVFALLLLFLPKSLFSSAAIWSMQPYGYSKRHRIRSILDICLGFSPSLHNLFLLFKAET